MWYKAHTHTHTHTLLTPEVLFKSLLYGFHVANDLVHVILVGRGSCLGGGWSKNIQGNNYKSTHTNLYYTCKSACFWIQIGLTYQCIYQSINRLIIYCWDMDEYQRNVKYPLETPLLTTVGLHAMLISKTVPLKLIWY